MILAQISDLHVRVRGKLAYQIVDTSSYLRAAVEHVNALDPPADVVLATGDLTDAGEPDEYRELREILGALRAPLYVVPGNHDAREALRAAFAADRYLGEGNHLSYVIDRYPLRIVALDSTAPGEEGGHIDAERCEWLDARLREDTRPTLIAMHHPPFLTGIQGMDVLGFVGLEQFGELIAKHRHVERITCGHIHRPITTRVFGTVATVAPSVAHQLTLDLRPGKPATFTLEPPGILLHHHSAGGLVTHVSTIGDYRGPYPFREPSGSFLR